MIIYKATNTLNGKVYIGQTKSLSQRKSQHKHGAFKKRDTSRFRKAIREYGFDAFEWEVIDTTESREEAYEKEIYWISYYDSYNNGYNSTIGGEGVKGVKPTKEQLDILKKYSWTKGYKHTEETKKLFSELRKGKTLTKQEVLKRAINSGNKPFLVFNLEGENIGEYIIPKWCAEELNIDYYSLSRFLRGEAKSFCGYVAMYNDEFTEELLQEKIKKAKTNMFNNAKLNEEKVKEIKELIKKGRSYKEISEMYEISRNTVSSIKLGKIWKHVD